MAAAFSRNLVYPCSLVVVFAASMLHYLVCLQLSEFQNEAKIFALSVMQLEVAGTSAAELAVHDRQLSFEAHNQLLRKEVKALLCRPLLTGMYCIAIAS